MTSKDTNVAIVTGASRGAGKGIALALAAKGFTVYITGRSETKGTDRGWDGEILSGSVTETALQCNEVGGTGIGVVCDSSDDDQVEKLFNQVQEEQGHLDILVNNATFMHDELVSQKPFWEKGLDAQKILDVGLRSSYAASWHAAKMMAKRRSGLIVFTSSFGASCYMHGPAYGAQKAGTDKLAHDMAVDLEPYGVSATSIWMGPLITERTKAISSVNPEQYDQLMKVAENPEFTGNLIYSIFTDENIKELNGRVLIGAEIAAQRYKLKDGDNEPPSYREMLGAPPEPNPARVY